MKKDQRLRFHRLKYILLISLFLLALSSHYITPISITRAHADKLASDLETYFFSKDTLKSALEAESLSLIDGEIQKITPSAKLAHKDFCKTRHHGAADSINSKVRFASVEIAKELGLDPKKDNSLEGRISRALASIPCGRENKPQYRCGNREDEDSPRCCDDCSWKNYYKRTISLNSDSKFLGLVGKKGFSPVKISWEDIGRYQGSVWGDRISDVGIWVRERESDPDSASLALSVRRDSNFRDRVLMVPANNIKLHRKVNGKIRELSLPERLKELGLGSKLRDKNVIVSNQFSIVPVPAKDMSPHTSHPPRSAFNFSIFPYGSTNFVITDVIEGSHEAIVGPGNHQLLFANVDGNKAPFTASRAKERQDLLKLESDLKSRGMDVDVQRYYLIQIPLKRDVAGIELSNMGTPPLRRAFGQDLAFSLPSMTMESSGPAIAYKGAAQRSKAEPGLEKVAIGTGENEGKYNTGSGFRGKRADEPIRVTVVYFVTPVGEVTEKDMNNFSVAFAEWDSKAIWGGSFVVPEKT